MNQPDPEKRPAHRPKGSTRTDLTEVIKLRLTETQRAKYDQLGAAWLRAQIENA